MALIDEVGSKLGITIDATSIPSQSAVTIWLKQGHNYLMQRLPESFFNQSIYTDSIATIAEGIILSLETTKRPIKLLSVFSGASVASSSGFSTLSGFTKYQIVSFDRFLELASQKNPFKNIIKAYPVAALSDKDFGTATANATREVYVSIGTKGLSNLRIKYLCESLLTSASTTTGDLAIVDELIVDYAVAQAQMNQEELNDAQMTLQFFEQRLNALIGGGK